MDGNSRENGNGRGQFILGALALIALCCTVIVGILFVALWQYREAVAWSLLALVTLIILVWLARSVNEMLLRRRRFQHQYETPLDRAGYPTLLQPGQQPYAASYGYGRTPYRDAEPHDGGEHSCYAE